jgi:hypothetical protein
MFSIMLKLRCGDAPSDDLPKSYRTLAAALRDLAKKTDGPPASDYYVLNMETGERTEGTAQVLTRAQMQRRRRQDPHQKRIEAAASLASYWRRKESRLYADFIRAPGGSEEEDAAWRAVTAAQERRLQAVKQLEDLRGARVA